MPLPQPNSLVPLGLFRYGDLLIAEPLSSCSTQRLGSPLGPRRERSTQQRSHRSTHTSAQSSASLYVVEHLPPWMTRRTASELTLPVAPVTMLTAFSGIV